MTPKLTVIFKRVYVRVGNEAKGQCGHCAGGGAAAEESVSGNGNERLDVNCMGGGRIVVNFQDQVIHIFSYSQGKYLINAHIFR